MFREACLLLGNHQPLSISLNLDSKSTGGGDVYVLGVVRPKRSGGITVCGRVGLVS